jgi:cell division septation protein DedD
MNKMAKYRQRSDSQWTISSTVMGWGVTGLAILFVGFFLAGIYVGYGMGIEEGKRQVRQDIKQTGSEEGETSDRIAQLIDEQDNQSAPAGDTGQADAEQPSDAEEPSDTDGQEGAFTEEDLGFLTEGSDTDQEATVATQTVDQPPSEGAQTASEPDGTEEADQGGSSLYGGSEEESEDATSPDEPTQAEEDTTEETSPYGDVETADTQELETFFTIQTVSFERRDYANRSADRLRDMGHSVMIEDATVNGTQYFRVRVGTFPTRSQAQEYAEGMTERGEIEDYWISQVSRE